MVEVYEGERPFIKLGELEFGKLRTDLGNYIQSSGVFNDYDFEGSAMSALIDLLAYNSTLYGYYASMIANESFLDTAVLRNSVISNAKALGYTPTSITAPTAVVDVVFNSQPSTDIIPFGAEFATTFDGVTYTFVADKDYSITFDTNRGKYVASNVNIKEGNLKFFS